MTLAEKLRSWWRSASPEPGAAPAEGAESLRARYLEHLEEEPLSPEQRVAHHLYHLMLYWSRLIGSMGLSPDLLASAEGEQGVLLLLPRVASEVADADVRAYAAAGGGGDLGAAWGEYQAALAEIPRHGTVPADAVRRASACYRRVDEARRALGLLHRYELRPPRLADAGDRDG